MTTEIKQTEPPTADPWSDLDRALEETRAQFLSAFGIPPLDRGFAPFDFAASPPRFRAPRIDVTDTGASYRILAEIPGIPKEQLDIRVRGTSVEIRGEQSKPAESKAADYLHRERWYAGFYRSLEMPEAVVAAEAKAKVANGVLELDLPKVTPTPSDDEVKVAVA